jgi:PAS domain S-box-containing protein
LGAEHARGHLRLLGRATDVLAPAVEEPRHAIAALAGVFVPAFADYFAAYLTMSQGALEIVAACHHDPERQAAIAVLLDDFPNWPSDLERAMRSTESMLRFSRDADTAPDVGDDHERLLAALGLTSWIVSPIRVRGLALGVLVAGAGADRRGLRDSDRDAIDEVSARAAMTVERGLLYREANRAVAASERRASELGRLLDAAMAFNRSLLPGELVETVAEQAAHLLEADRASAWLGGEGEWEAVHGTRPERPTRTGAPMVDATGESIGYISVERSADQPFEPDGPALTLLARLASAAAMNASLYDDLRNREQRLEALVSASPLVIVELDRAGAVQWANPAAARLFPYRTDDPSQPELPDELLTLLRQLVLAATEERAVDAELTTAAADGSRLDLWVSVAALPDESRRRVGSLAVISDVTARRRLEQQLIQAKRSEAVAQVAGGVAHDFNNLLTVIVGYSEMLLRMLPAGRPERDDIAAIHEAGSHAAVITNQLLMLSRRQVVRPVVVSPAQACRELHPMLQRLAGGKVTVDIESTTNATVRVDSGQLEQILLNLVLNSRDAMPDGGHVGVLVSDRVAATGASMVAIAVSDDGQGMDDDTLTRCREPFFTTKGRAHSTGLGLATVASIVQGAGGDLEIDSVLGDGTTVTALLPVVVSAGGSGDGADGARPARVLVVDDSEEVRVLAERILAAAGYEVTAAADAEEAIVRAEVEGGFDLLVSDVVLPGMSGIGLARTFMQRWPATARVLMTGFAGGEVSAEDVVDTPVVTKPFSSRDLERAAASALQGSNL